MAPVREVMREKGKSGKEGLEVARREVRRLTEFSDKPRALSFDR